MTPNESALQDLISACDQADAAAWERAVFRLRNPDAPMIEEIFRCWGYPGPCEDAVDSRAVQRLMELGAAEFLDLHAAGERMISLRLRRSMRETVNGFQAVPAQAPVPQGAAPPAPVADFGPGV